MLVTRMLRFTPSLIMEEGSDNKFTRSLEALFTVRVGAKEDFYSPLAPKNKFYRTALVCSAGGTRAGLVGTYPGRGAPRGAHPGVSKGMCLNQGRSMVTGLRAREAILNIRSEGQERLWAGNSLEDKKRGVRPDRRLYDRRVNWDQPRD